MGCLGELIFRHLLLERVSQLNLTRLLSAFDDWDKVSCQTTRRKLRDGLDPLVDAYSLYPGMIADALPEPMQTNARWVLASFKAGGREAPKFSYVAGAFELTEAPPEQDEDRAS